MNCYKFGLLDLKISISVSVTETFHTSGGDQTWQYSGTQISKDVTKWKDLTHRAFAACGKLPQSYNPSSDRAAWRGICGYDRYLIKSNSYFVGNQISYTDNQGFNGQTSIPTGEQIQITGEDWYIGYKMPLVLFPNNRAKEVAKNKSNCKLLEPYYPHACNFQLVIGSYGYAYFENYYLTVGTNSSVGIYSIDPIASYSGSITATISADPLNFEV